MGALSVPTPSQAQTTKAQLISQVEELRAELGIPDRILISIVGRNDLLISVRPSPSKPNTFIMKFDRKFLTSLSDEELRAAIAHELGHVWIFTHQPYVQSESLANDKALKLVGRESLTEVYKKVWVYRGEQGTLAKFLDSTEEGLARQVGARNSGEVPEPR